jgi:hypothetical protein
VVGTDHAVFNSSQKAAGRHDFRAIPNGVNGIEERLHVVWDEMVASGEPLAGLRGWPGRGGQPRGRFLAGSAPATLTRCNVVTHHARPAAPPCLTTPPPTPTPQTPAQA